MKKITYIILFSLSQVFYANPKSATIKIAPIFSDSIIKSIPTASNTQDSLSDAKDWLKKSKAEKNWRETTLAYRTLMYKDDKKYLSAYSDSLISSARKTGDDLLIGSALLTKGIINYDLKKHREALDYYLLAERHISKTGNAYALYKIKYSVASSKYYLGYFDEAISLFRECVAYFDQENDRGYLNSLHSLGLCYNRNGDYALCDQTNRIGIAAGKELGNREMEPYFVHSQGVNSYFKKDYRLAIDLISSSLPALSGKDDFANVAVGNFYIGKSLFALGREPEAIAYMQKVYAAFLKHKYIRPDLREAFEILIDHYKKKGELKLQLRHIETLLAADRIIAEEQAYMSKKIYKEYDTNELNREKIRIEKQLRNRNYAIYFITSISFFTIACLVYRHAANKKFYDKRYDAIMHPVPADDKNTAAVSKEDKSEHTDDVESGRPYLPQDVIDDILDKLDYFESEKMFLDSSLGLEELEKMFGYNRRYISLVIQNEKNLGFLPYLNSLKIINITALLRTDTRLRKYTTSGLAAESGFTSGKIFSRTFKKINGIPHLEFIERRNAEDEAEQRSLNLEKDNTPEEKE